VCKWRIVCVALTCIAVSYARADEYVLNGRAIEFVTAVRWTIRKQRSPVEVTFCPMTARKRQGRCKQNRSMAFRNESRRAGNGIF
jgi:hypothetical protein